MTHATGDTDENTENPTDKNYKNIKKEGINYLTMNMGEYVLVCMNKTAVTSRCDTAI